MHQQAQMGHLFFIVMIVAILFRAFTLPGGKGQRHR